MTSVLFMLLARIRYVPSDFVKSFHEAYRTNNLQLPTKEHEASFFLSCSMLRHQYGYNDNRVTIPRKFNKRSVQKYPQAGIYQNNSVISGH